MENLQTPLTLAQQFILNSSVQKDYNFVKQARELTLEELRDSSGTKKGTTHTAGEPDTEEIDRS